MRQNAQDPEGYYKLLGLQPGAGMAEVKDAITKKQREYHPNGSNARMALKNCKTDAEKQKVRQDFEEKVKKINEAKLTLTDEKKKQAYDTGMSGFDASGFSGAGDFFDIFSHMTGGSRRNQVKKVKDTIHELNISFKDAYMGKNIGLNVKVQRACNTCEGKGGDQMQTCGKCNGKGTVEHHKRLGPLISISESPCTACNETGRVVKGNVCSTCKGMQYIQTQETINLRIDPGVTNGKKFVYTGRGNHKVGHVPGDIIVVVSISRDSKFKRVGNNITSKADIPLYTALVGGHIYFDHVDGRRLEIYLKPFTNLKKCIVVKGEGFRIQNSGSCGDLYIDPNIVVDKNIDRDLLAKALKYNPSGVYSGQKVVKQGEYGTLPSQEEQHEQQYYEQDEQGDFFGGAAGEFFSRMRFF